MRTKEEINAEYSKVCSEIGHLEWQKAQKLNHICMLNDELAALEEKPLGETVPE